MLDSWTRRSTKVGTAPREELVSDAQWDALGNPLYELGKAADVKSLLMFTHRLPAATESDWVFGVTLHRTFGDPNFDVHDRTMLHLFNIELYRLHRAGKLTCWSPVDSVLTDRQRTVLHELLAGHGTKQIARNLRISRHTVNDHVKAIYRRLSVGSVGELLSKFVPSRTP